MDLPKRKSMRLPNYNYGSNSAYFLTICTKNKACTLADIAPQGHVLTSAGKIADKYICSISTAYPCVSVDKYVIMPNHIHIILSASSESGVPGSSRPTETVPKNVAAFKRFTNKDTAQKLWQDGYYDHIIRDENDYLIRWNYIDTNPARWHDDDYYSPPH
jgi:putative transposase